MPMFCCSLLPQRRKKLPQKNDCKRKRAGCAKNLRRQARTRLSYHLLERASKGHSLVSVHKKQYRELKFIVNNDHRNGFKTPSIEYHWYC